MKKDTVIIVALKEELNSASLASSFPVIYSGIGKVNAALATFKAIQQFQAKHIINFGTVGKINPHLSGLVKISEVLQRDMLAVPLAPRGVVPFSNQPSRYYSAANTSCVCGTGDSFVTEKDPWLNENMVDVVDMELFAIASIASEFGISWSAFKYISDEANSDSGTKWQTGVNEGEALFLAQLQQELMQHPHSVE